MEPIAHIRTDLPQKFGIPRQSGLAADLQGQIVFEPEFALESAVRGLDGFNYLWLIWQFENGQPGGQEKDIEADTKGESSGKVRKASWSPTVRPPRLGGDKRMGVFATRSPFRPNPIGLSCVRLDRVETTKDGPIIHVLGADLRDGTPILDIKPYIPYADCHTDAVGGFTDVVSWKDPLEVEDSMGLLGRIPDEKRNSLREVLSCDPRPPYHDDPDRVYGLAFAGFDVHFTVSDGILHVTGVDAIN